MVRSQYILGNWKMNKTRKEADAFFQEFVSLIQGKPNLREIIGIAAPFTVLSEVSGLCFKSGLLAGAQNASDRDFGAFTGEVSPLMLTDIGVRFVILGHSERRSLFKETNVEVGLKMRKALDCGLLPVFCIGETEKEREEGSTQRVLHEQIVTGLDQVGDKDMFAVAYEPVWAIGSGKIPEVNVIDDAHRFIRSVIAEKISPIKSEQVSVLYGGSVTGKNIGEISSSVNVDGVLVGGASLSPVSFFEIVVNYSSK